MSKPEREALWCFVGLVMGAVCVAFPVWVYSADHDYGSRPEDGYWAYHSDDSEKGPCEYLVWSGPVLWNGGQTRMLPFEGDVPIANLHCNRMNQLGLGEWWDRGLTDAMQKLISDDILQYVRHESARQSVASAGERR